MPCSLRVKLTEDTGNARVGLSFSTQLCVVTAVRERLGQITGKEVRLRFGGSGDVLKDS